MNATALATAASIKHRPATRTAWTVVDTATGERYGTHLADRYYAEIEVGQVRGRLPWSPGMSWAQVRDRADQVVIVEEELPVGRG